MFFDTATVACWLHHWGLCVFQLAKFYLRCPGRFAARMCGYSCIAIKCKGTSAWAHTASRDSHIGAALVALCSTAANNMNLPHHLQADVTGLGSSRQAKGPIVRECHLSETAGRKLLPASDSLAKTCHKQDETHTLRPCPACHSARRPWKAVWNPLTGVSAVEQETFPAAGAGKKLIK